MLASVLFTFTFALCLLQGALALTSFPVVPLSRLRQRPPALHARSQKNSPEPPDPFDPEGIDGSFLFRPPGDDDAYSGTPTEISGSDLRFLLGPVLVTLAAVGVLLATGDGGGGGSVTGAISDEAVQRLIGQ
uniref:Uncharacterized protein n=2 Tax=Octactis speculum TaxID=3111310 RepID=A0A7S2HM81_9STRA|mmetsp:Transcript_775/g.987  ORF Transcript_775/g.987 Transcript_775/m.987 type:complete len:132 (+) Transcript_775:64-459(+)